MTAMKSAAARLPSLLSRRDALEEAPASCEDPVNVPGTRNQVLAADVLTDVSTPSHADAWIAPSWDEIVRQHSPRVFRLAYRLTGNKHDAEDLTQEVFVRVFRSLDSYTPGTFEGWIHRITTNLFLDLVRRRARIRFDALPDDAERVSSGERTPAERYDDGLFDADVQAALDALAPEFRAAVVLCDIEGLSYEEIADVLDIKLGTVRSRIHRGRTALRKSLAHRSRGPIPGAGGVA